MNPGRAIDINNPYESVDWDTYTAHRTELHCHTSASDGDADFNEMVEAYYAAGYDCLAITDHGVVDRSWTKPGFRLLPRLTTFNKHPFRKLAGLTEERFREIAEGMGRDGRGMLRVPFGTEHSPGGNRWAHVCSWFCDVPSAALGRADYTKAVRRADNAGALCVINHPTSSMKNGRRPYEDVYEGKHAAYVQKLWRLFEKHPSLLGIEQRTVYDCKLWDILLRHFAPMGRNVFAVATTDAHDVKAIEDGLGWVEAMMPENTVEALRECLEDGAFFAASRYASFISTPEFHAAHPNLLPVLREEQNTRAINKLSEHYGGFCGGLRPISAPRPMVTRITAEDGVISIEAQHCDTILWISDGKLIASGDTLMLADCEGLGAYVRAELWGPGGNLYAQPFLLQYET
jgi:histidinol phosphatase-like PHP family hydrolase